jgi:type II secretory pathway pseudopilin PulG
MEEGAMKRAGFSLIEISIVSMILIILLIVIYSTFIAGDRFFQNESVIRDAQFSIRRILEQATQEISEGTPSGVWKRTDTTITGAPNKVLIILSARDPSDPTCFSGLCPQDVHNPSSLPVFNINWLAFIVYAPYPVGTGKFELRRYTLKLPGTGISSVPTPLVVTFSATQITLTGFGTINRDGGAKLLDDLTNFEVGPSDNPTAAFNDPPTTNLIPSEYTVTLERRVQITPKNFSKISLTSSTKGRN